jgi:hypothetical protein
LLSYVKDKTCAMAGLRARKIIFVHRHRGRARVHAVHSIGTTTSTKLVAPNPRAYRGLRCASFSRLAGARFMRL